MTNFPLHSHPIAEYARTIYEIWDKEGKRDTPNGCTTWMDYWHTQYDNPPANQVTDPAVKAWFKELRIEHVKAKTEYASKLASLR